MLDVAVSVAVSDWLPAVSRVAEKRGMPWWRGEWVEWGAWTAWRALWVKGPGPVWAVASFRWGSWGGGGRPWGTPAVVVEGKPESTSWPAAAAVTDMLRVLLRPARASW